MVRRTFLVTAIIAGLVPMAFAQLSSTDQTFVMKAAKANTYEIRAAQLADQNSNNNAYKQFAEMIISDHTKAGDALKSAVAQVDPSMPLPTGVSSTDQQHLNSLQRAGSSFDTTYRSQMISTHMATVKLFQDYIAQPNDNPQLKQFAEQTLPVLRKHWNQAKMLPKQ